MKGFNIHSIRSIKIAKLKTKSSQGIDTCEYEIGVSSDGNLMTIRMYKMLFPHNNVSALTSP